MNKFQLWGFTLFLLLASCKQQKPLETVGEPATDSLAFAMEGKKLMEQKCYLCHSPTASQHVGRVGPPMIAVKAHYLEDYPKREAFVTGMVDFVLEPTADKVKLKGANRRFGLMPKAIYTQTEIEKIAAYIYDYRIKEPEWFQEHWASHGKQPYVNSDQEQLAGGDGTMSYAEKGMAYALGTKKVLGANLMGTIQKEGVAAALAFCNERAYPLTDSMSVAFNAQIKRVSDRPRNPQNQANTTELEHINTFKKALAPEEKVQPIVQDEGDKVYFYAPIATNQMCLKCHGNKTTDVSLEVKNLLMQKYPADQATGYGINEVRGIWSITFEKKKDVEF